MDPEALYRRYCGLQSYVSWDADDVANVRAAASCVEPHFQELVEDFYREIDRHPEARQVITGGREQIERLKGTLVRWLQELFSGRYDRDYVMRRHRVGLRHVEIGLDQVYANVALSRLRMGLGDVIDRQGSKLPDAAASRNSLNKLLDLDLAIIEEAYQTEFTLRQQRAQQLRLLSAAVRDVKEGVLITLADRPWPDPAILFANDAATRITGFHEEELLRATPRVFGHSPANEVVLDRLNDELSQGRSYNCELLQHRTDGAEYFVELHVSPVFDAAGDVGHYVATLRDATERKRAEEQLMQAERLAAIGQMVTGLAHESRNALQRSKTCLEMLAHEVNDRPEALDLVHRANLAQDHLHHLYEEVRSYAAPLRLRRQKCRLRDLWTDTWGDLELSWRPKGLKLIDDNPHDPPELHVDRFALGQVLRNIFENAVGAAPERTAVTVKWSPTNLNQCPAVQIAVRDSGPGLNEEQRKRIFDPFYTTKTKGTGLGMAIAKRIVEAHDGRISVGASANTGAELIVTLPLTRPPAEEEA